MSGFDDQRADHAFAGLFVGMWCAIEAVHARLRGRDNLSQARWWNDTQLLQHAHLVEQGPAFSDLAVFDASKDHPLGHNRPAGRRVAQEQSCMRAAYRPVRCNFATRTDFVLDSAVEIGESRAEHGDQLLEPFPSSWHAPARGVGDAVGRYQFIYHSKAALVEGLLKYAADERIGSIT
jgi:hypothetical protein